MCSRITINIDAMCSASFAVNWPAWKLASRRNPARLMTASSASCSSTMSPKPTELPRVGGDHDIVVDDETLFDVLPADPGVNRSIPLERVGNVPSAVCLLFPFATSGPAP
jgi:hypothetical protein